MSFFSNFTKSSCSTLLMNPVFIKKIHLKLKIHTKYFRKEINHQYLLVDERLTEKLNKPVLIL